MASSSSSLSSALSSMEQMLDALRQRGIGKPDDKPKEEEPPALPTRPTVRGRPPSIHRPASSAPWSQQRPPLALLPPPPVRIHHVCFSIVPREEQCHACMPSTN